MRDGLPSLAEMNRRHEQFWALESEALERRMADPLLRAMAFEELESDISHGVPVYAQSSLEFYLEQAERRRTRTRSADGRSGGRPRGGDALQKLIVEIVTACPEIAMPLLLARLEAHQHGDVIEDIGEGDIWYVDNRGRSKSAPISGLKDRLTRARKFLSSQKPV